MRVWVTRSQPQAAETARRLEALGLTPLVAPLLAVRPLATALPATGVDALAFTSGHAIAAAHRLDRDLPVFCVGEATAQAALKAGFTDVHAGPADVAALAALIASALPPGATVLHPAAAERAGDLAGPLAQAGVILRPAPVYETVPAPLDAAITAALAQAQVVLLYSPKAAGALNALVADRPAAAQRVLCLSPAVMAALDAAKFADVAFATLPNDTALLNLLQA